MPKFGGNVVEQLQLIVTDHARCTRAPDGMRPSFRSVTSRPGKNIGISIQGVTDLRDDLRSS
jgi:hypothetical protein